MNNTIHPMEWLHHELVVTHGVESSLIQDTADIIKDLGLDSLDMVELIMSAEHFYEIQIPDEDAEKLRTINECVVYLGRKVNPMLVVKFENKNETN
jgi:acyl carrier protein